MATKKYLSLDRLTEYDALIKAYADNAATTVKNDLLNGAGEAYDTLKELGELIDENVDAIEALETIASTQPDWNQNDETATDYIKNRTHWSTPFNYVYPETTWNLDEGYCELPFGQEALTPISTYKIVLDNVEYTGKVNFVNLGSWGYYILGNGEMSTYDGIGDLTYPFMLDIGDDYAYMLYESTNPTCTFSMEIDGAVYQKLDPGYLPEFNVANGGEDILYRSVVMNDIVSNIASGSSSTAMGWSTKASGQDSVAMGQHTVASGRQSVAMGLRTEALGDTQVVMGNYNIPDSSSLLIVGNGGHSERKNVFKLEETGTGYFAGDVYVGHASDSTQAKKLATEEFVLNNAGSTITAMTDDEIDAICNSTIIVATMDGGEF